MTAWSLPGTLLLAMLLVGCSSPPPPSSIPVERMPTTDFLLGGIQVNEPDMETWLDTLQARGFDTVSLTVYARHGRWDSAEIEERAETEWVIPEIRAARERGLEVVLILRVALEHGLDENRFLWHGMIMPETDDQVREWFDRYGAFVRQWAEIAEREGVGVLGIGSELNALASTRPIVELPPLEEYYLNPEKQQREMERTLRSARNLPEGALEGQLKAGWGDVYEELEHYLDDRTRAHRAWAEQVTFGGDVEAYNRRKALLSEQWHRLVTETREVYDGDLTYAANFDQYMMVDFWDALDLMGINAYFPLRHDLEAMSHEALFTRFREAWTAVLDQIDFQRGALGVPEIPVLFTELGYTRRAGGTFEPWAGDGFGVVGDADEAHMLLWRRRPLDPQERALAVRALGAAAAEAHPDLLAGVLYWKLSTLPEHLEIEPFVLILGSDDPLEAELLALATAVEEARPGRAP